MSVLRHSSVCSVCSVLLGMLCFALSVAPCATDSNTYVPGCTHSCSPELQSSNRSSFVVVCCTVQGQSRSVSIAAARYCSVLLGIAGCAGIAYRAIPSGPARSVFGKYRPRYTEAYRARYTTLLFMPKMIHLFKYISKYMIDLLFDIFALD